MLASDVEELKRKIKEQFGENCSIEVQDDREARFSLKLEFEGYSFVALCTDARVSASLYVNEFDRALQSTILMQVHYVLNDVISEANPLFVSVWRSAHQTYSVIPSIEKLSENPELAVEFYSGPCNTADYEIACGKTEELVFKILSWIGSVRSVQGETEGSRRDRAGSEVERSIKNRNLCISLYGYSCQICHEILSAKYGSLADKFIHVHHIESIAASGVKWIDPRRDLITVCPNCHSMLHRTAPPMLPNQLKSIIKHNGSGEE